jgi:DMSO/TMAO reductase YedYZ molybdopterin-dependent catalytic subunit
MATVARRNFVHLCLGGTTTLLFACTDANGDGDDDGESEGGEVEPCTDLAADGTLLGTISFVDEAEAVVGVFEGSGLDGRLALDLNTLEPDTLLTANEDFFIRTAQPDILDPEQPWVISIAGLVESEVDLSLAALAAMPTVSRVVLLECSGNGSSRAFGLISAAEWSGVLLSTVLEQVAVLAEATAVLIAGFDDHSQPSTHSTPGCSWVFRFDELVAAGAMLATHMNGEPLPPNHGAPVRLIIPGWYGCCNPKWVDTIRLVDASEPATAQMLEFAARTHQSAAHELAADYAPGIMQQAAMPVRIEQWMHRGELVHRIVGILWGGSKLTEALAIRFDDDEPIPVELCEPPTTNDTWTLWSYIWRPTEIGEYEITMVIEDPGVPTLRLDTGFYARQVIIESLTA